MDTSPEWKAAVARMMAGQNFTAPQPAQVPSAVQTTNQQLQRQAAALLSLLPQTYLHAREPVDNWWIPQQQQTPMASQTAVAPQPNEWGDVAKEADHREAITNQLGDFSKRVLANRWFMGGE